MFLIHIQVYYLNTNDDAMHIIMTSGIFKGVCVYVEDAYYNLQEQSPGDLNAPQ